MARMRRMLTKLAINLGVPTKDSPFRHVNGPPAAADPYEPAARSELDLTCSEVKQIWWFLDGSINAVDVRHHLWRSWGFCPRHTWTFMIAAIELRAGIPFQPSILYEDLTRRAATACSGGRHPQAVMRALSARASCLTCDFVGPAAVDDPGFALEARRVNARTRTARLLRQSQPIWEARSCPSCLGGRGIPCRPHLLAGKEPVPADLGPHLQDLTDRLHVFMRSMTWHGPSATEEEAASWVEAAGFFGGWSAAQLILARGRIVGARAPSRTRQARAVHRSSPRSSLVPPVPLLRPLPGLLE